jgi:hypothetical protein
VVNTNTFYRSPNNFRDQCNILLTFLIALPRKNCQLFRVEQPAVEAVHGIMPKRAQEKSKEMIGGVHSAPAPEAMLTMASVLGKQFLAFLFITYGNVCSILF